MAAMIHNDEEKAWMLPLLNFRNDIAGKYNEDGTELEAGEAKTKIDRARRDFRRMDGKLKLQNTGSLIHGPYKKEVRENFLRKLLILQKNIRENGPEEVREVQLIRQEELECIRDIWLNEKHEFDDSLPRIYEDVMGEPYSDHMIQQNRYYGLDEWVMLKSLCEERYPKEELLLNLLSSMLDITAKASMVSKRKNVSCVLEKEIQKCFYRDEEDALAYKLKTLTD